MDSSLLERAKAFLRAQRKKNIWYRTMCGLAAVVVFITTYMLILPAITMERNTICGKEEHKHTGECYEIVTIDPPKVLSCTKDTLEVHTHTDACYDSDHNLICGYADFVIHTHDENCYNENGELVCTLPEIKEHEHTASCYQEEKKLICGQEESEGHTHTAACYKKEKDSLECIKEEHKHDEKCYDENGNLICIKEEHIHEDTCYKWTDVLVCTKQESEGHKHTDACYETISHLICDKQEAVPHIHTDSCYKDGKLVCDKQETIKHQHTDECWKADGEAKEEKKLVCDKEEHEHSEECYKKETESVTEAGTEETNAEAEGTTEAGSGAEKKAAVKGSSTFSAKTAGEGISAYAEIEATDLTDYLTNVSGGTIVYSPENDYYTTQLTMVFNGLSIEVIKNANYEFTYTFPEGVIVPSDLIGETHSAYDSAYSQGPSYTYEFVETIDDEGKKVYSVNIHFSETYIRWAENGNGNIDNSLEFNGYLDGTLQQTDGNVKVQFKDSVELILTPDENTYPDKETRNYDLSVNKSGSYVAENGEQLLYTVEVISHKGTPDPIVVKDVLEADGLSIDSLASVTVQEKITKFCTNKDYGYTWSENIGIQDVEITSEMYQYANGEFSMKLPGLLEEGEPIDGGDYTYTQVHSYIITYIYNLNDIPYGKLYTIKNSIKATAEDNNNGESITDTGESYISIDKRMTISKTGWYDSEAKQINWTITVNDKNQNIAGMLLTDEKLADAQNISIDPASDSDYTIMKEGETITGIQFNGIGSTGVNNNKYVISYSTEVEETWDTSKITNSANIDTTPGEEGGTISDTGEVYVSGGSLSKYAREAVQEENGLYTVSWTIMLEVPSAGLPEGTTVKDEIKFGYNYKEQHYMTKIQASALAQNLIEQGFIADVNELYLCFYENYQEVWKSLDQLSDTDKAYGFKFNTAKLVNEGTYTITYDTTADTSELSGEGLYQNKIQVGEKNPEEDVWKITKYKGSVVKTDGNNQSSDTSVENSDGKLTWKVKVTLDSDNNYKYIEISDTLPENINLTTLNMENPENIALTVDDEGNISGNGSSYSVTGQYDSTQRILKLKIQKNDEDDLPSGTEFVVRYDCQVSDSIRNANLSEEDKGRTYSFTNYVSVSTDKGKFGSDSQTQNWTEKVTTVEMKKITKSGNWNNDGGMLEYSIDINPGAEDLLENGDTLTLTDQLFYWKENSNDDLLSVSLAQDSVQLFYAQVDQNEKPIKDENGRLVQGDPVDINAWDWGVESGADSNTYQWKHSYITAHIPDGKALIFRYKYYVEIDGTLFNQNDPPKIENTASIDGVSENSGKIENKVNWKDEGTSGSSSTGRGYTFYKVDSSDYSYVLDGAEFALYKWNAETNEYVETGKNYITENGKFIIQWQKEDQDYTFDYNTAYYVEETKAPVGYLLPDKVEKYYFQFSNDEQTDDGNAKYPEAKPDDFPASAIDLCKYSYTEYVENVDNTTDITVEKKWEDKNGNSVIHTGGLIKLQLYQKTNAGTGGSEGSSNQTVSFSGRISDEWGGVLFTIEEKNCLINTIVHIELVDMWSDKFLNVTVNGQTQQPTSTTEETYTNQWNQNCTKKKYIFDIRLTSDTVFSATVKQNSEGDWEFFEPSYEEPTPSVDPTEPVDEGTPYGESVTITASDGWKYIFKNLPLAGTDENGKNVSYFYYVQEETVQNYDVTYSENNTGIQSGTITVTNKAVDNPEYEIPETGGPGTRIAYTLGSILMLSAVAFLYIKKKKMGEKGGLK